MRACGDPPRGYTCRMTKQHTPRHSRHASCWYTRRMESPEPRTDADSSRCGRSSRPPPCSWRRRRPDRATSSSRARPSLVSVPERHQPRRRRRAQPARRAGTAAQAGRQAVLAVGPRRRRHRPDPRARRPAWHAGTVRHRRSSRRARSRSRCPTSPGCRSRRRARRSRRRASIVQTEVVASGAPEEHGRLVHARRRRHRLQLRRRQARPSRPGRAARRRCSPRTSTDASSCIDPAPPTHRRRPTRPWKSSAVCTRCWKRRARRSYVTRSITDAGGTVTPDVARAARAQAASATAVIGLDVRASGAGGITVTHACSRSRSRRPRTSARSQLSQALVTPLDAARVGRRARPRWPPTRSCRPPTHPACASSLGSAATRRTLRTSPTPLWEDSVGGARFTRRSPTCTVPSDPCGPRSRRTRRCVGGGRASRRLWCARVRWRSCVGAASPAPPKPPTSRRSRPQKARLSKQLEAAGSAFRKALYKLEAQRGPDRRAAEAQQDIARPSSQERRRNLRSRASTIYRMGEVDFVSVILEQHRLRGPLHAHGLRPLDRRPGRDADPRRQVAARAARRRARRRCARLAPLPGGATRRRCARAAPTLDALLKAKQREYEAAKKAVGPGAALVRGRLRAAGPERDGLPGRRPVLLRRHVGRAALGRPLATRAPTSWPAQGHAVSSPRATGP